MTIRHATQSDLGSIRTIYNIAKQFMRDHGNPNQWDSTYPSDDLLIHDMELNRLYVIETDSLIHAVFVLTSGPDPTYSYIEGNWLNDSPYFVIHRIASDNTLHHVLARVLDYAQTMTSSIRIDTHKDNTVMQHLVIKNGFTYCGIIYLEDGSPRLAYQKDFNKKDEI